MPSDDDDIDVSLSSHPESIYKARREALKQKLKKEGGSTPKATAELKTLKLAVLKVQVAGKNDAKDKRDEADKQKAPLASVTKSREQEIAASKLTVNTKPTADKMVEEGKVAEAAQDALKQDEVQSEDA